MDAFSGAVISVVESLYRAPVPRDVPFAEVMRSCGSPSDDELLADLIDADGRMRLRRGLEVSFERYSEAVPDLRDNPVALDAAIDIALRSLSGGSKPTEPAVRSLLERYPDLREAIMDAAMLGVAVWSTNGLQEALVNDPPMEPPCEFGPPMPDGRRRFEIRRVLGRGASGHVYAAVDRQMSDEDHEAIVALKVRFQTEESELQRLLRADEATRTRRIDHPHVIRVLDRGLTADDREYIVCEFVDGEDLSCWLKRTPPPLPAREAASMIVEIARGVQAAHSAGLIHCDLKPGNVMRHKDGTLKVSDFGVAMNVRQPDMPSRGSAPIGNLAFISPEQFRLDAGAVSPPSDIYALGGILFLLLTGVLPNGQTLDEIRRTHDPEHGRTHPPPFPQGVGVDRDLRAICHRAMAQRPENRYESAGAMADDLERWKRGEPLSWTGTSIPRRVIKWIRRKPVLAGLLLTVIIALSLGITALEQRRIHQTKEQARRDHYRDMALKYVAAGRTRDAASQLFMSEIAMRLVVEAGRFTVPGVERDIWLAKITALQRYIREAEEGGFASDVAVQMIKWTVAVQMLGEGLLDEASVLIDELQRDLPRVIPADDTLHVDLAATAAARDALVMARDAASRALDDRERELLRAKIPILRARADHYERYDLGSGLHHLYLLAMQTIYGPDLLNDEHMHRRISDEIDVIRKYDPLFAYVYDQWKESFDQRYADDPD